MGKQEHKKIHENNSEGAFTCIKVGYNVTASFTTPSWIFYKIKLSIVRHGCGISEQVNMY